ncbi:MAG: type VI secretion system tip protein TssI/VgrG [Minicystis sp.]
MSELLLTFESKEESLSVRQFSVHEEMSTLFCASVFARSPDDDIDFESIVGRPASFRIRNGAGGGGGTRTYTGICSHMEQVQAESSGLSTYYLNIVPRMWLLTQRTNHRLFQHLSIPDIVTKLLGEWKIEHRLQLQGGSYPELELRVQYGESDYAFISRLLEEAGISFTFAEDGDKGSVLVLCDTPQANERRPGGPIPYLDNPSRASGEFLTRVRVAQDVRPGRVTLRDADFRRNPIFPLYGRKAAGHTLEDMLEQYRYAPGSFLVDVDKGAVKKMGDAPGEGASGDAGESGADLIGKLTTGLGVVEVMPGLPGDDKGMSRTSEKAGHTRAQRHLESARATRKSVVFETNLVGLPPGTVIAVKNHARADLDGDHALLVTSLSINGAPDIDWTMSATATFADVPFRPPLRTPKPTIQGIQSAVVTGPSGEEIHTDELGRVRVQFHWDREGNHDENSSCWMRVNQGWAGSGFGMVALPRVGQEVLVAFLEGNPDLPVVVGRLFSSTARAPYSLPSDKTKSGWKSASSPGGGGFNEIMFEDAKGKELFNVQAERDLEKLVKNDETITIGRQRRTSVGTVDEAFVGERHTVAVRGSGGTTYTEITDKKIQLSTGEASIILEGPNITLEAKGKILLHSTGGDVELLGGPWVKINCGPEDEYEHHELTFTDPFGNPMVRSFLKGELSVDGGEPEVHDQFTSRSVRVPPGKEATVDSHVRRSQRRRERRGVLLMTTSNKLKLKPKKAAAPPNYIDLGFEHGCPGAQVHLGLRFQDQPGTGVDGKAFPRSEWEQSPFFVPNEYPVELAGVAGVAVDSIAPAPNPQMRDLPKIDSAKWKTLISASTAVTAKYFLVHDTGGGALPTKPPTDGSRGIHLFIGSGKLLLNHDFSEDHTGTKFESRHTEFKGKILHMEIVNRSPDVKANPADTYGEQDYYFAALAYVYASYRASEWLTVTCHLEVDRGICNGHSDPRGFSFDKFYRRIGVLVPSVAGKTFGILQARMGNGLNDKTMKNTFPAQYGAVQYEKVIVKCPEPEYAK